MQSPIVLDLNTATPLRPCPECRVHFVPNGHSICPVCRSAEAAARLVAALSNSADPFTVNFDLAPEGFVCHAYGPSGAGEWWRVWPAAQFYGWDVLDHPSDCWQVSGYSVPMRLVSGEVWQSTRRVREGGQ